MDAADLYGLPLDRFVAERTSLARALRTQGRREQAAEVASLRKPSVAAWAVNQLVRTQGRSMAELFDAGDALRKAQDDVLAGRSDARALRAAAEHERMAADALVTAAHGLLSSEGDQLSAAVIDRLAETLHAAALDDQARAALQAGCLERELRHVGLGGVADGVSSPTPPSRSKPAKRAAGAEPTPARSAPPVKPAPRAHAPACHGGAGASDDPAARGESAARGEPAAHGKSAARGEPPALGKSAARSESAARERAAVERAERQRLAERKAARAAESEARRRADRTARAVAVAQRRRERAARELAAADESLTAARAEADHAADDHRHALEKLQDR